MSLVALGGIAFSQGEYDKARTLYEEGLEIRRLLADRRGIANCLVNLAHVSS